MGASRAGSAERAGGYPPLEAVGEAAAEALERFAQQPKVQPHPLTVEEHDSMASKFTPERQAIILEALRQNPSVPSAASKAGISSVTLNRWINEGLGGNEQYREFALEAQEARRFMKDEIVAALYKTATDELHPQQTKAAHLLLTNLYPVEFANVKHSVTHKPKDPEIDLSKLPTEELRAFHRTLKKIQSGTDTEVADVPETVDVKD
jgi:transposase-like protein